jgi:hypothetical protein
VETTCWNCDYDLAGLPQDQPCPECGVSKPWLQVQPPQFSAAGAIVLGFISLLLALCAGPLSLAASLPALVLSVRAIAQAGEGRAGREDRGLALAGAGFALTGIGLCLLLFLV